MAMTRKHYQALAEVIKSVYTDYDTTGSPDPLFHHALVALAGRMAAVCEGDNSNFDRDTFMKACGFSKD